jgi:hypothetical protein
MKLEEINNKTNEAFSYLVAALESDESEVLTQYLNAMARFHTYSFGNIMLIARQKPAATRVAGIRTWNSLGRFVKRGEKGILILAPMVGRKRPTDEIATEVQSENSADERKLQQQLYGFRAVYVFDVSQTEGKELPALTDVEGDVTGYRSRLIEYVESQNVKLRYSEKIAPAKGLSSGGRITLLAGMRPAEEFSTLVHEMAHEMLHRSERRTLTTKQVRETEAEAVAFVVCQSIGLETGSASADYIRLWNGDAKLLAESLGVVQRTAAVILGAISPEVAGSQLISEAIPGWLGTALRFKMMGMADTYEVWIGEVQQALRSVNMSMDDWQSLWPFDFHVEYNAGTKADDAAMKANRFWWHEQNRSLKRDCRLTPDCWLPSGHQGSCQPVNSDAHGVA